MGRSHLCCQAAIPSGLPLGSGGATLAGGGVNPINASAGILRLNKKLHRINGNAVDP